jgi:hypothetical protein
MRIQLGILLLCGTVGCAIDDNAPDESDDAIDVTPGSTARVRSPRARPASSTTITA